jgi:hypothetical protein
MTELPSYLEHVVEEAIDYYQTESDASISEAAVEIATSNNHLTSSLNENRDNLEVLQDLRDYTGICADELETYRNYLNQGESPAVHGGRESDTPRHKSRSALIQGYPL